MMTNMMMMNIVMMMIQNYSERKDKMLASSVELDTNLEILFEEEI